MQQRYHGLDNWRAILLLIGPLIHSTGLVHFQHPDALWADTISQVSHVFRMEAFFVIAGFFGALTQLRHGDWLKKRMISLGVPLFTGWIVLMIPVAVVTQLPHWWAPQHMWFVLTLMTITVPMYIVDVRGYLNTLNRIPIAGLIAVIFGLRMVGIVLGNLNWHYVGLPPTADFVCLVPYYLSWYIVGMLVQRRVELQQKLIARRYINAVIAVVLLATHAASGYYFNTLNMEIGHRVWKILHPLHGTGCAVFASMAIIGFALSTKTENTVLKYLSRSAYSVYILHYPIILLAATMMSSFDLISQVLWLTIGSVVISIVIHEFMINRFATMAFFFNGKSLEEKRITHASFHEKNPQTA